MRQPSPVTYPVALTVAGSDSGGGAGVQADLKTFEARDAYGTSAVTAVTAQHTTGVESTHVLPPTAVAAQIDAVAGDFDVDAVKTGMLATADIVDRVHRELAELSAPIVVDPVMVATSGDRLLDSAAEAAYFDLVADATIVTPNAAEAAVLTDRAVETEADARDAALDLLDRGVDAALVTGGHLDDARDRTTDVLATADGITTIDHRRVADAATHGSGCTLSAAVTADLASATDPTDPETIRATVESASAFLERAIRYHHDVGEGPGAVHHLVDLRATVDRATVASDVERIVAELEQGWESTANHGIGDGFEALLPEVGTNVVGAPPTAESVDDTVAVDGRLRATHAGVRAGGGVRPGASSHVARFLLAAREQHPELRFAANCRYDDAVADALDRLDWSVAAYDRRDEPATADGTMDWGAEEAFGTTDDRPVAVVDKGAHGKEPMTKFATETPDAILDRLRTLAAEY